MEVTPGYKQTGMGVIPREWETSRLQDMVDRNIPIAYGVLKPGDYVYNGVPLLQIRDVIHGDINVDQLHRIGRQLDRQYLRTRLVGGEIVVSLVGTIGKVAIIPMTLAGANLHRNLARVHVSQRHDSTFVFYFLNADLAQAAIKLTTFGSTQALLNLADLRGLMIVVPPLPEQRAIASALCDVDALLGGLDRLITKKRDLKQAAMQQLLSGQTRLPGFHGEWEVKQLGETGTFLKGSGVKKDDANSGDLPCIRYGEIYTHHNDHVRLFNSWISSEVAATATRLRRGDLLFAGSGETKEEIGKCVAFVDECAAFAGGDIVILRLAGANPMFMGYYCNTAPVNAQKASKGQGDAVVHISAAALSSIEVTLPSYDEQTAIATVLFDMDAELAALEARRHKTRDLKQAMMQELLTGKTRLVPAGGARA